MTKDLDNVAESDLEREKNQYGHIISMALTLRERERGKV